EIWLAVLGDYGGAKLALVPAVGQDMCAGGGIEPDRPALECLAQSSVPRAIVIRGLRFGGANVVNPSNISIDDVRHKIDCLFVRLAVDLHHEGRSLAPYRNHADIITMADEACEAVGEDGQARNVVFGHV